MGQLAETMLSPSRRTEVVDAYTKFIHVNVMERGIAVRTAYAAFKKMKKGHVEESVELLLPGFMGVLDVYYDEYLADGNKSAELFAEFIGPKSPDVATKLLDITDEVIAGSGKPGLAKLYGMIRGVAHKHVTAAIPGMAAVAESFLSD